MLSTQLQFTTLALYETELLGIPRLRNDISALVREQIYCVYETASFNSLLNVKSSKMYIKLILDLFSPHGTLAFRESMTF
jgi:hypothetical protein